MIGNIPTVFSHRGSGFNLPENTAEAFRKAIQVGAIGIKTDVRTTRDGVLVLSHDPFTEPDEAPLEIARTDFGELRRHGRGNGAPILRLDEALDLFGDESLWDLEIRVPGIENLIMETVRDFKLGNRVLLSSFDAKIISNIKAVAPRVTTGLVMGVNSSGESVWKRFMHVILPRLIASRANVWITHKTLCYEYLVHIAHSNGIQVWSWPVNSEGDVSRCLRYAVDGLITETPEFIFNYLDQ